MINKNIIISELAGEQTFMAAEEGCFSCQQSCAGKWFAPGVPLQNKQMQTLTDAEVAVSGIGLNTVVAVLFGLPLLLLLGFGYAFQVFGITTAPLLSLAVIATALLLAGVGLSKHGAKLIPLLRVEVKVSHRQ
jgi:hypothetical protein